MRGVGLSASGVECEWSRVRVESSASGVECEWG